MTSQAAVRELAGVLVKDLIRYLPGLVSTRRGAYLGLRNRSESLEVSPDGSGVRCNWQWTSELHAPKVIPMLGHRLMKRALAEHPIELSETRPVRDCDPQVCFLIGHRGDDRTQHLLATLRSIAGQAGASVECVVVEQDVSSRLASILPKWVRLIHAPPPSEDMPYCRSWAFNVGALHTNAKVLVLHDNDMLVPRDYSAEILDRIQKGFQVVNAKRFVFYLTAAHTNAILNGNASLTELAPESIVQNLEGGGSVAITRDGFDGIGGMDESFVGWGGEDNDFWERASTLRSWPWASLPIVHLCHAAQSGKQDAGYHTAIRYRQLAQVPVPERISRLKQSTRGSMQGPFGWPRVHPS
jgi:hypothetical protein